MGMYFKQQQQNTRLHSRLTQQLDTHLNQPKQHAAAIAAEKPIVSLRWALFMVFMSGGCVAILLGLLHRQNPNAFETTLHARTLALLGLASIIFGCLTLLVGRNRKSSHHHA